MFFNVNFLNGDITLKQSVLTDSLLSNTYYMKLLAYDTAYPNMLGTATATIFVNRNPNAPQFVNPNCRATIPESAVIGQLIFNSTATDRDGDILRYSFGANTDTIDSDFFYLNPENGNILLKRLLTDTTTVQFQVR